MAKVWLNCTVQIVPFPTRSHTGLNSGGGGGFSAAGSTGVLANAGGDATAIRAVNAIGNRRTSCLDLMSILPWLGHGPRIFVGRRILANPDDEFCSIVHSLLMHGQLPVRPLRNHVELWGECTPPRPDAAAFTQRNYSVFKDRPRSNATCPQIASATLGTQSRFSPHNFRCVRAGSIDNGGAQPPPVTRAGAEEAPRLAPDRCRPPILVSAPDLHRHLHVY